VVVVCLTAALAGPTSAGAVSSARCNQRVNDTPNRLVPCITTSDLWNHMQAFWTIAQENPGPDGHPSRNAGEPGYKASVDYVAKLMRQAGYTVTLQPYTFPYTAFTGTPSWSEDSPTHRTFTLVSDWNAAISNGTVSEAQVKPAGGIVLPPTPTPSSASGCSPADFAAGFAGKVALIQRGGCFFGVKVQNAAAAGASGVIIFNEGQPGRTDANYGPLSDAAGALVFPTIPVAFTSFATGQSLYDEYQAGTPPLVNMSVGAILDPNRTDWNVIAESKGGDPDHVVVVDAHLDAIFGAGMLDNASGSATILDVAQQMRKVRPLNKLRFIWFGGEELGELGSAYYVQNLSVTELAKIRYDLDADVMATPNYSIGILDPAAPDLFSRTVSEQFPPQVYGPSRVARHMAGSYFRSIGKNHILFSPVGTDAEQFQLAGIPASGLLTGQDCCKTQEEVDLFGGSLGNYEGNVPSFDGGCVDNPFRWCDNLTNNDPDVLTFMSKAFADMTVRMAFNRGVVWAGAAPARGVPLAPAAHSNLAAG
jgi:hypothetical protein